MKCCICNSNFKIFPYILPEDCRKAYKIKHELKRESDIDKVWKAAPLLLDCGHAVCVNCKKNEAKYSLKCLFCNKETVVTDNISHHYFMFGCLLSNTKNKLLLNTRQKLSEVDSPLSPFNQNEDLCQECSIADKEVFCKICSSSLCKACFQKVHEYKTTQNHKAEILTAKYSISILDCPDHNKECDFVCNTCSNIEGKTKAICSVCHFAGEHTLHSYSRLEDWNREHFDEFSSLRGMLKENVDLLLRERQACLDNIQNLESFMEKAESYLFDLFLKAHGQLQINHQIIVEQLRSLTSKNIVSLMSMGFEMEKSLSTGKKYLNVANSVQEKNICSANISSLIENISSVLKDFVAFEMPTDISSLDASTLEKWIQINPNIEENSLSNFVAFDVQNYANLFRSRSRQSLCPTDSELSSLNSSHIDINDIDDEGGQKEAEVFNRRLSGQEELGKPDMDLSVSSNLNEMSSKTDKTKSKLMKTINQSESGDKNSTFSSTDLPDNSNNFESLNLSFLCQKDISPEGLKTRQDDRKDVKEYRMNSIHQEEEILVSHIEDKLQPFYIQRLCDKNAIEALSSKIDLLLAKAKPLNDPPSPGTLCLGQFSRDSCWYRALILSEKRKSFCVKFIDYGNTDWIPIKRLRECPEDIQLNSIPPFAYPCCLWCIEPVCDRYSEEALLMFHYLVSFQERMELYVYSSQPTSNAKEQRPLYYVDIRCISNIPSVSDDLSLSIRDCFLFLEFGKSTLPEEESLAIKENDGMFCKRSYHKPHIAMNSTPVQVKVTSLSSPSSFYVQSSSSKALLKITIGEMKQHYTSDDVVKHMHWKILSPKIGMLCAVKCSSDNLWLRARIDDVKSFSKVFVTYVDTGEEEIVHYERLYKIPDKFVKVPAQGIHCKLANVAPINDENVWKLPTIEKFQSIITENNSIMATFCGKLDDIYEVNLLIYFYDRQLDIASELIDSNLALPNHDSISDFVNEKSVEYLCNKDEFETFSRRTYKKLDPFKNDTESMVVNHNKSASIMPLCHSLSIVDVVSPSLIFARFSDDEKLYEDFQDSLYKQMISLKINKNIDQFHPKLHKYYVAKFEETPFFARVFLLEECDSHYKAFLVDFGGIKNISKECLLTLPKEIKKEKRKLCQVLSIAGICPPCGLKIWPTSAVDFLKRMLNSDKQIFMLKRGCCYRDEDNWNLKVMPVDLGWFEENTPGPFSQSTSIFRNIKMDILEKGLALPKSEKLLNMSFTSSMDTLTGSDDESRLSTLNLSDVPENNELIGTEFESNSETESEIGVQIEEGSLDSSSSVRKNSIKECLVKQHLPPQPPLKTKFKATVTYIESDGTVCLHPVESNKGDLRLSMMQKSHNFKFNDSRITDKDLSWAEGDYVAAKYHLDNSWYRAKVLNKKEDENHNIKVEFIDYGNVEYVSVEDIRGEPLFMNIPPQCYRCSLGVVPIERVWPERLLNYIHEITVTRTHQVTLIQDGSPPVVELIQEGNVNVGDVLVKTLEVCIYANSVEYKEMDTLSSCDIVVESDEEVFEVQDLSYPTDPSELVVVKVVSVVDPSVCYISPQKDVVNPTCVGKFWKQAVKAISALEELQQFIRVNYSEYKLNQIPLSGGVYLNHFAKEANSFLRVKVLDIQQDEILVKFIDFGNEKKISAKTLYIIPKKYRNVPALAIRVRIQEINNDFYEESCGVEALQMMENCLMGTDKKMYAAFQGKGNPPEVSLFFKNRDEKLVLCYQEFINFFKNLN